METADSKNVIGHYLHRSERWVYQSIEKQQGDKSAEPETVDPSGPTRAPGREFSTEILLELGERYPEAVSATELEVLLQRRGRYVKRKSVAGFLDLYERLGLLRQVGSTARVRKYAATSPMAELSVQRGAYEKVSERLRNVPSLALAYCLGRGEFGGLSARLHPDAFARARDRLKEAVARIIAEATEETHLSDEPSTTNVLVSAIIAIGMVGGSHDSVRKGGGSSS